MDTFKVGIIGMGHVGAHVLYTIASQGLAGDILIYDLPEKLAKEEAERQDVLDCSEFFPRRYTIRIAKDISEFKDRDVIVNAVGDIIALKGTHTRLTELSFNMHAIYTYAEKLRDSGFKGVLINISNPCDVITKWLADILALPGGRVFGTGTGLDTARLKLRLEQATGISAASFNAYMIGEHGNEQIAAFSQATVGGISLDKAEGTTDWKLDRPALEKGAREGGWTTYNGKFCTEYAIAQTAVRLVRAVKNDQKCILAASCRLEGEYGESGLFAGVPAVIGKNGVEKVVELPLTAEEKKRFHKCCDSIRANIEASKELYR